MHVSVCVSVRLCVWAFDLAEAMRYTVFTLAWILDLALTLPPSLSKAVTVWSVAITHPSPIHSLATQLLSRGREGGRSKRTTLT